jgi:hypothetical protein
MREKQRVIIVEAERANEARRDWESIRRSW